MSDDNAEKAWEKHVADIAPYPVGHYPDRGADERGRMYKRGFMAGRASRDAEVAELRQAQQEQWYKNDTELASANDSLRQELTAERTRADKAEAEVTRLREVIKQVRAWNEHTDFIGLETIIATAVPVEPQGDRPHYEIIVPGCDCVGCFGEAPGHENGSR